MGIEGTPITGETDGLAYCDVTYADSYFDNKLNMTVWTTATETNKEKALITATNIIDRLNFRGVKADETQSLEFPRDDDTTIPYDIANACAEIAYALLDGKDVEMEIEQSRMTNFSIGTAKTGYNTNISHPWIMAGIPSFVAWTYLKSYLADGKEVRLERVS